MYLTKQICSLCRKTLALSARMTVLPNRLGQKRFYDNSTVIRPLRSVKGKSTKNEVQRFLDWTKVRVEGGKGGDGRISLLSVYLVEFAGPDGGDGGHGGHVIFCADPRRRDFSHLKTQIKAEMGKPGGNKNMHGKDAGHRIVPVPVGTIVRNMQNEIVCDLAKEGSMFIAAKGGAGGKGNASFKSSSNQTPKVAEIGADGEAFIYSLELRTMADVGLIGFPNAGKSTLLQAISRARPKVAAYPFTTLNPHIGMVMYDDLTQLAVADLPGLISGSSKNHGLGHAFLRHVERCRLLLYVLDLSSNPIEQLECLQYELEEYSPGLSERPSAIVANKIDLEGSSDNLSLLKDVNLEVIPTSGKMGMGLQNLLIRIKQMHDQSCVDKEDHETSGENRG